MKLMVCFKICSDLSKLKHNDLEVVEGMGLATHFLPNMINCFDESNLEFAIRLSEKSEGLNCSIQKTGLSIGEDHTEQYLNTLIALGYDHAIRVPAHKEDFRYSPEDVAYTIAKYNEENPQDVILTGRQAPEGNNWATGQLIASMTGYPLISSVIDIDIVEEGTLNVTILSNGAIYQQTVVTPVVLSVGNAVISRLRTPTLRQRMASKDKKVEYYDYKASGKSKFQRPHKVDLPDRRRMGYISQLKGEEAVEDILDQFLSERLGEL